MNQSRLVALLRAKGSESLRPLHKWHGRAAAGWSRAQTAMGRFYELGILLALLLMIFIFSLLSPYFFTKTNLGLVVGQASLFGVMVVGMTFVIIAGEIDLSVGSVYGMCLVGMAISLRDGTPLWLAIVLTLAIGAGAGFLNGIMSVFLRVPTIIITLGTLSVYRGITWWVTDGFPVDNFKTSSAFSQLGNGKLWGTVPYQFVVLLGVAIVGAIVLRRTVFGRHVYATGSNNMAAQFSGIRVGMIKVAVLTIIGLCAGIAGVMGLSVIPSGDPNGGTGYELDVIAATIVGGTKLFGGQGTILGSIIGVMMISGVIRNGLVLTGVSAYGQVIVSGAIVVTAVALDTFVRRRRDR